MKKETGKTEEIAVIDTTLEVNTSALEAITEPATSTKTDFSKETIKTKQLSIKLPEHVHRKLKAKVALEGESAIKVVTRLVMQYVEG